MNKDNKKAFNKRRLKYGAAATAITIFVIVIIVFINLIADILTERKGLKIDLTSENLYEISQDTLDYIKAIDSDVEIAVMMKKDQLENSTDGKMVVEILANYERNSDHISVEYYDITENPDIVNKYAANYNGDIKNENIVIACGDRIKVTSVLNLFNYDSYVYYQTGSLQSTGFKGEQQITSAIMRVTDANPIKIAVISMYNSQAIYSMEIDNAITSFVSLLNKNGYEYEPVDIFTDEISPDEYNMVILPAPASDLTDDCIKKLEDFLYNNGNLDKDMIYIADVAQRKTPKIDEFLEVWGIEIGGNQVIESDNDKIQQINISRSASRQAKAPVASIADESYSEELSNTKLPIVAPATRNIKLLFDANVDRTTKAILKTSETSVLHPLNITEQEDIAIDLSDSEGTEEEPTEEETESTTEFDIDNAEKSENVVMALVEKSNTDSNDVVHKNKLLVIGGASFTDPYITGVDTFNNAEFIVNTVNKISDKENGVFIAEKNFESTSITVTSSQLSTIKYFIVYTFPAIVIICGIIVYLRRRNK